MGGESPDGYQAEESPIRVYNNTNNREDEIGNQMNSKQIREAKRGVAMAAFAESRAADFTHTPPLPVDAKQAATLVKANRAISGLGGKQAIQLAGEFSQKTSDKVVDREAVEAMLKKINGTVAAIAEETTNPGLMDRFRMPHGNSDMETAAKLDSFAEALGKLGLYDELAAHNLAVTAQSLADLANGLRSGTAEQVLARGRQTGATATIPELLKSLRECKKTWDAIYQNTYDGNVEVLTAWRSASHIGHSPEEARQQTPRETTGAGTH